MTLPAEKMAQKNFTVRKPANGVPIKLWNKHVVIEDAALKQLDEVVSMPFVRPFVAAMPDTHWGMGATVGSVIPTVDAVMPAAVGVDIGCGMIVVRTTFEIETRRPTFDFERYFRAISEAVPHGRTDNGGDNDIGAWPKNQVPEDIAAIWRNKFASDYSGLLLRQPMALSKNAERHLGTLGTGNHFIELCVEIDNPVSPLWIVIHSGSRGLGNRIGTHFTKLAGELCRKWGVRLPNKDLGYLPIGTQDYEDYLFGVRLAQEFAWHNRLIMTGRVLNAIGAKHDAREDEPYGVPSLVHVHHNYMTRIRYGRLDVNLTRKGAVDASVGNWVIIPGSMGAKTYIGCGLGNPDSFFSCSHGAGRAMSRIRALKTFTVDDHLKATEGVCCDKTTGVLDETPAAYKDIDAVMESQKDLVEPVLKLKQIVCVKGLSD